MNRQALYATIAAFILGLDFGWLLTTHYKEPCPVVDDSAAEDSLRALVVRLDSTAKERLHKLLYIDSLNAITQEEREDRALHFLRSSTLEQQLDSVLSGI